MIAETPMPAVAFQPRNRRRAKTALQALNFFMADMQAGIGPFLGRFLQPRGWTAGPIGTVMTLGGVAGMLMTAPCPAGRLRYRRGDYGDRA